MKKLKSKRTKKHDDDILIVVMGFLAGCVIGIPVSYCILACFGCLG